MENEFDYYFIRNSYDNQEPALKVDDEVDPIGTAFLSFNNEVPKEYVAHLTLASPVPPKPNLTVDGLGLEGNCSVFSRKIFDAVNPYNFKGIQFVPTVIRGKNDEEFDGFYIANIYQKIASFDPSQTEFEEICELTGAWDGIESIVLDKDVLSKIALEDRLVYVAQEHPGFILYHKTIIDVIMATNPDGLIITPVEEWYNGIDFE